MDKLLVITTLLTLSYVHCIPVESPATITVREPANVNCGTRLTNLIETCLIPFEQKLVVYRAPGTSEMEKYRMRTAFCREYEKTLQCLHTVLLQCPSPPALEHLNIIERRVGYLRGYMNSICRVPLEAMTPRPTTRPTTTLKTSTRRPTSMTSLATLLKTAAMDPTTPRLIIMPKSTFPPEGSSTKTTSQPKFRSTRPTTYDVKIVTNKLDKLKESTPADAYFTPTPKIEVDLKDHDKSENDIPLGNVVLPNIETSAIEDNIIRVNNPSNCDTKLGHANNPRCSMLQASSSSALQATILTILTLLSLVLL